MGLAQLSVCVGKTSSHKGFKEKPGTLDPGEDVLWSHLLQSACISGFAFSPGSPHSQLQSSRNKRGVESKRAPAVSVDFSLSRLLYGLKNFSPFLLYSGAHWSLANRWYQTFPSLCYGRPMEAYLFEAFMQIIAYCPIRS